MGTKKRMPSPTLLADGHEPMSLGELAARSGHSPREIALVLTATPGRRVADLWVRGGGWRVAWNARVEGGYVVSKGSLDEAWEGIGRVRPDSNSFKLDQGFVVVNEVIEESGGHSRHGLLVSQDEEEHELLSGERVEAGDLLVLRREAVDLLKGLDDPTSVSTQTQLETALRLVALLAHMVSDAHPAQQLVKVSSDPLKSRYNMVMNENGLATLIEQHLANHYLPTAGLAKRTLHSYLTQAAVQFNAFERGLGDSRK